MAQAVKVLAIKSHGSIPGTYMVELSPELSSPVCVLWYTLPSSCHNKFMKPNNATKS